MNDQVAKFAIFWQALSKFAIFSYDGLPKLVIIFHEWLTKFNSFSTNVWQNPRFFDTIDQQKMFTIFCHKWSAKFAIFINDRLTKFSKTNLRNSRFSATSNCRNDRWAKFGILYFLCDWLTKFNFFFFNDRLAKSSIFCREWSIKFAIFIEDRLTNFSATDSRNSWFSVRVIGKNHDFYQWLMNFGIPFINWLPKMTLIDKIFDFLPRVIDKFQDFYQRWIDKIFKIFPVTNWRNLQFSATSDWQKSRFLSTIDWQNLLFFQRPNH